MSAAVCVSKVPAPLPRVSIACASDNRYAIHAAVMVASCVENAGAPLIFTYLHPPGFLDANKALLEAVAIRGGALVNFVEIPDSWVADLPVLSTLDRSTVAPIMWYRLFLPQILADSERVLYLDCDTVVLGSLTEIWATTLLGAPLAAVSDPWIEGDPAWAAELGINDPAHYFNSGVLLINLQLFREQALANQIIDHGRRNCHSLRWADQDSLNSLLAGRQIKLHPKWNLLNSFVWSDRPSSSYSSKMLRDACMKPRIVHFEGAGKPWTNPNVHPYAWAYMKYREQVAPGGVRRIRFSVERELARRQLRAVLRNYRGIKRWLKARLGP